MESSFAVTAKLSSNAYFSGDFLFCEVNVKPSLHFFFLSAEVHGICRRDTRWVTGKAPGDAVRSKAALDLGFGGSDRESCVLECAVPTVLACEVATAANDGEQNQQQGLRSFLFYVQLPFDLIPSFRGSAFQYFYFASISVTIGQSEHKVIKVPFRVLRRSRTEGIDLEHPPLEPLKLGRMHGCITLSHPDDVFGFVELADDVARGRVELARAFGEDEGGGGTEWALLLPPHHCPLLKDADYVREMSDGRAAKFFERAHSQGRAFAIQSKSNVVVDWRMDRTVYLLGEQVKGTLDFNRGQVACHRVHMALLRREIVRGSLSANGKDLELDYVVDELDRDTFNALKIPVVFHLPPDHSQTFSTKSFAVRWMVKFVFYCAKNRMDPLHDEEIHELAAVDEADLDRIEWELDVPFAVIGAEIPTHLLGEPSGSGVVV
jgi:hypothetical protein